MTKSVVLLGMLAALAFVLMATVQVPLLPQAPYLRYDPSDVAGLLAGVLYGPGSAALVVLVKDVLYLLLRARSPFGPAADFVAAATFVAVTAWVYRRTRGSRAWRFAKAAAVGAVARVAIMVPTNFVILYLQFGMPAERVASLLVPVIVPFNVVKALANAVLALPLVEPVCRLAYGLQSSGSPWRRTT